MDISLKVSAKDKVKIIKIFEIDRRRINNKTESIFEIICTYVKESQNCKVWKGPQEIIRSNLPAKAGSVEQAAQVGVLAMVKGFT